MEDPVFGEDPHSVVVAAKIKTNVDYTCRDGVLLRLLSI
jgi:hypothetical protein